MKKRNTVIDIMKGVLIALVVFGHTQFWGHDFIYLFHMSSFFMISGLFFKNETTSFKDNKKYLLKRFKQLYIPYIICNATCFLILSLILKNISFKSLLGIIIFKSRNILSDSTWFLQVLFFITIIILFEYCIIKKIKSINTDLCILCLNFLLMIIGYLINIKFYLLDTILSNVIIFNIGYLLSKNSFLDNNKKISCRKSLIISVINFLILLISLRLLNGYVIRVMQNEYFNPIIYIMLSIIGFLLIYHIGNLINERTKAIKKIFIYIGKKSIWILCLHVIAFKIISILQMYIYDINIYDVINNISCKINSGWWILYGIIGVIFPIIVERIYNKLVRGN